MAEKASLRDYQRALAERLKSAEGGNTASKLGLQAGGAGWLVDLTDAGEVIPVPAITSIPLTRPWFKGVTNIRGKLYSVVDFPAFLGGTAVALGEQARLLLVADRFRTGSALLVERSLGLRNSAQLKAVPVAAPRLPWVKAEYADAAGKHWKELDVAQLVQHPDFLGIGA